MDNNLLWMPIFAEWKYETVVKKWRLSSPLLKNSKSLRLYKYVLQCDEL